MSEQNALARIAQNSSLLKSLGKSMQVSSLSDLVRVQEDQNIVLLLDVSGSMDESCYDKDGRVSGKKIKGLRDTVNGIQTERTIPMVAFPFPYHGDGKYVTEIPNPGGGTPLHEAIDFAKSEKVGRAIVISDGEPDDRQRALQSAKDFGGRIDVVFVGKPGSSGEEFLKMLAEATGGESFTGDLSDPKQLTSKVMGLLGSGEADDEDED